MIALEGLRSSDVTWKLSWNLLNLRKILHRKLRKSCCKLVLFLPNSCTKLARSESSKTCAILARNNLKSCWHHVDKYRASFQQLLRNFLPNTWNRRPSCSAHSLVCLALFSLLVRQLIVWESSRLFDERRKTTFKDTSLDYSACSLPRLLDLFSMLHTGPCYELHGTTSTTKLATQEEPNCTLLQFANTNTSYSGTLATGSW